MVTLCAAVMRTRIKFTLALGALTLWFTLKRSSDGEGGGVNWAGPLLVLAGTFLSNVGDLGCEIVAIGDARDSSTIGRTMPMQDTGKISLMGLLCALEMCSRFFVVVPSLFLYAALSSAIIVLCGCMSTTTVITSSVAVASLSWSCASCRATPVFAECVETCLFSTGI